MGPGWPPGASGGRSAPGKRLSSQILKTPRQWPSQVLRGWQSFQALAWPCAHSRTSTTQMGELGGPAAQVGLADAERSQAHTRPGKGSHLPFLFGCPTVPSKWAPVALENQIPLPLRLPGFPSWPQPWPHCLPKTHASLATSMASLTVSHMTFILASRPLSALSSLPAVPFHEKSLPSWPHPSGLSLKVTLGGGPH